MAAQSPADDAPGCPVDHKSRQAWFDQARTSSTAAAPSLPPAASPPSVFPTAAATHFSLDQSRMISSIPRAPSSSSSTHGSPSPVPANAETNTPASASGNWIYPSEQMFFDAMRRKSFSPREEDMRSIVPIHNAVNERAWAEIKTWESGRGSEKCGGPKLVSFSGQSDALTPKARLNTLLGYTRPFDRHDWVVDRCGTRVDYVIDFYAGRNETNDGRLNFYLDVRPKLNTFEGCRMRLARMVGL